MTSLFKKLFLTFINKNAKKEMSQNLQKPNKWTTREVIKKINNYFKGIGKTNKQILIILNFKTMMKMKP